MRCAKIGKTAGKACKIHVGIDFTIQKEIDKHTDMRRVFAVKLEKLKELISAANDITGERYKKMIELRNRLDTEIRRLSAIIDRLQSRVIVDENARVTVNGEISQGTLIEICQVALFVDTPMRHVTLKLDKTQGRIVQQR
jgi:tRNA(Phe) wybutosine-synthesizing methylase Tyw3